jgi:hypothetical protein
MELEWEKFRSSFEKFVVKDLEKALNADIEVGIIILTAVGIECLSGYFAGKASNGETFKGFIDKFMPTYSIHAETIYKCIRNGLAHDYIIKENEGRSFLFTRNRGEKHLDPVEGKPGWYYLNRESFALDFLKAQTDFFEQVNLDENLSRRVLKRLRERSFLDVFSFRVTTIFADPNAKSEEYSSATGTFSRKP